MWANSQILFCCVFQDNATYTLFHGYVLGKDYNFMKYVCIILTNVIFKKDMKRKLEI